MLKFGKRCPDGALHDLIVSLQRERDDRWCSGEDHDVDVRSTNMQVHSGMENGLCLTAIFSSAMMNLCDETTTSR